MRKIIDFLRSLFTEEEKTKVTWLLKTPYTNY